MLYGAWMCSAHMMSGRARWMGSWIAHALTLSRPFPPTGLPCGPTSTRLLAVTREKCVRPGVMNRCPGLPGTLQLKWFQVPSCMFSCTTIRCTAAKSTRALRIATSSTPTSVADDGVTKAASTVLITCLLRAWEPSLNLTRGIRPIKRSPFPAAPGLHFHVQLGARVASTLSRRPPRPNANHAQRSCRRVPARPWS